MPFLLLQHALTHFNIPALIIPSFFTITSHPLPSPLISFQFHPLTFSTVNQEAFSKSGNICIDCIYIDWLISLSFLTFQVSTTAYTIQRTVNPDWAVHHWTRLRMGNCQAAEAATVVIQHPGNKVERIYWSVSAHEVMNSNPGHYVALVINSPTERSENGAPVKHLKLLRPADTLLIGQVYRLVSFEGPYHSELCNQFKWITNFVLVSLAYSRFVSQTFSRSLLPKSAWNSGSCWRKAADMASTRNDTRMPRLRIRNRESPRYSFCWHNYTVNVSFT